MKSDLPNTEFVLQVEKFTGDRGAAGKASQIITKIASEAVWSQLYVLKMTCRA